MTVDALTKAPASALTIDVLVDIAAWVPALDMQEVRDVQAHVDTVSAGITKAVPEVVGAGCAVLLTDDTRVAQLNLTFRDKTGPTNVLSFPAEEAEPQSGLEDGDEPQERFLGDIAIALETVQREAVDRRIRVRDHLTHLLVHGILHLCGYDHLSDDDANDMESLEGKILEQMGIADPYGERAP